MNTSDLMTAIISLMISFTISFFIILHFYDVRPQPKVVEEDFDDMNTSGNVLVTSQKRVNNMNGDGFYNKLMAMHEMKMHHTLCSNMLSITSVKMNLSLDEIIKIRSYIRVADHRMRKYMKKAAPHPYGQVLKAIYNNYDNTKMYTPIS